MRRFSLCSVTSAQLWKKEKKKSMHKNQTNIDTARMCHQTPIVMIISPNLTAGYVSVLVDIAKWAFPEIYRWQNYHQWIVDFSPRRMMVILSHGICDLLNGYRQSQDNWLLWCIKTTVNKQQSSHLVITLWHPMIAVDTRKRKGKPLCDCPEHHYHQDNGSYSCMIVVMHKQHVIWFMSIMRNYHWMF